jgi:hypothetical protein
MEFERNLHPIRKHALLTTKITGYENTDFQINLKDYFI